MSFGEAALKLLKEHLVPEVGEIKQSLSGFARIQGALVAQLESMERRMEENRAETTRRFELLEQRIQEHSAEHNRRLEEHRAENARRFDLIDKRFEMLERRVEEQAREHARRMELLETRMELLEKRMDVIDKRMERVEGAVSGVSDRLVQLTEAVAKLSLLGDYVRRMDELAVEVREMRRRQDEFERRFAEDVLPRLPKVGT